MPGKYEIKIKKKKKPYKELYALRRLQETLLVRKLQINNFQGFFRAAVKKK